MYQGGVRVLPSLLGYPPLSILRLSIPVSPHLTLPPGLPLPLLLMTFMPTHIHYRAMITLMILTIVSMTTITLILIPRLPRFLSIRLDQNTAA